jgi:hypothetical protein
MLWLAVRGSRSVLVRLKGGRRALVLCKRTCQKRKSQPLSQDGWLFLCLTLALLFRLKEAARTA